MGTIKNRLNLLLSALGRSAAAPERGNRHMAVKPLLVAFTNGMLSFFAARNLAPVFPPLPLHAPLSPLSGSWAALGPFSHAMALFIPGNQQVTLARPDKGSGSWVWHWNDASITMPTVEQFTAVVPQAQATPGVPRRTKTARSDRKPPSLCLPSPPVNVSACQCHGTAIRPAITCCFRVRHKSSLLAKLCGRHRTARRCNRCSVPTASP